MAYKSKYDEAYSRDGGESVLEYSQNFMILNGNDGEVTPYKELEREVKHSFNDENGRANINISLGKTRIQRANPLFDAVSDSGDRDKVYTLVYFMIYPTNIIGNSLSSPSKSKTASVQDIANILDIGIPTCKKFLSRMIKAGVIGKCFFVVGDEYSEVYIINPYYFDNSGGNYYDYTTFLLFRDYLEKSAPKYTEQMYEIWHGQEGARQVRGYATMDKKSVKGKIKKDNL